MSPEPSALGVPGRAPESGSYTYTPFENGLQQIRLLRLQPRHSDGVVRCSMETYDLRNAPVYRALSYTWGDAKSTRSILVDDKELSVRQNLHDFLMCFQDHDKHDHSRAYQPVLSRSTRKTVPEDTLLWIDQISIDQSNMEERSNQVQLMSEVFSRSSSTIVWLGRDRATLSAAEACTVNNPNPMISILWANPYFTRVWILQEMWLSSSIDVLCGTIWLFWGDFRSLSAKDVAYKRALLKKQKFKIPSSRKAAIPPPLRPTDALSLHQAISRFPHQQCVDPRDRLYGLLSIVKTGIPLPVPDYTKTVQEVCLDAAVTLAAEANYEYLTKVRVLCSHDFEIYQKLDHSYGTNNETELEEIKSRSQARAFRSRVMEFQQFGHFIVVCGQLAAAMGLSSDDVRSLKAFSTAYFDVLFLPDLLNEANSDLPMVKSSASAGESMKDCSPVPNGVRYGYSEAPQHFGKSAAWWFEHNGELHRFPCSRFTVEVRIARAFRLC